MSTLQELEANIEAARVAFNDAIANIQAVEPDDRLWTEQQRGEVNAARDALLAANQALIDFNQ